MTDPECPIAKGQHPEQLDRDALIHRQSIRLRALLKEVQSLNPFWRKRFASHGIRVAEIQTPGDLSQLPCLTKAEIVADQAEFPPFGSNLTYPVPTYSRLHQTSGTTGQPVRWLDHPDSWSWMQDCWGQIYRMVGMQADDRLCFAFSFGPFLGFWAAFDGAQKAGHLCLSAGGLNSLSRLQLILDLKATFVLCTPTYALRLIDVANEAGIDLRHGSVRGLIVAGEPGGSLPATRTKLEEAWGARLFDHWGMTELGPLATESQGCPGSLYVLETECIAEILQPGSEQPVVPGEVGELVITNLGRIGSPVLRYRTGDLVKQDLGPSPDGYSLMRLAGGILGRTDDMLTIRGNNVYPSALEDWIRQIPRIAEYRITVRDQRSMQHLLVDIEPDAHTQSAEEVAQLLNQVATMFRSRLNFQVDVQAVPHGSLPRFEMKGRRFQRLT